MSTPGEDRVREYLKNPEGKLAFVLAGRPDAETFEFILVVAGDVVIGKIEFPEAWELADFLYQNLPPRNKAKVQ